MPQHKLQPYVYPFRGILIDANGLPTKVPFSYSRPERITPGVLAGKADTYKREKPIFVLACSTRSIEVRSSRLPEYIGRGMIRLHAEPEIENDRIVNTELEVIEHPDRSFGSIDNAAYIWDDESLALIDIDEHPPSQHNPNRRFRAAFPDGNVSSIELQLMLGSIHLDQARPLLMKSVLGRKGAYAPGLDENIHHIDAGFVRGQSSEYVMTHSRRHGLKVFDNKLELITNFDSWKSPFLTKSNRIVSFDRHFHEGVHVQSIDGDEINHLPEMKMFLYAHAHANNWYIGRQPEQGPSVFDDHFNLRATLPNDCFNIALSPDGYAYTSGSRNPNNSTQPEGKLFRCFSPDGDLVQSFSWKTQEEYERVAQQQTDAASDADDRRNLRIQPKTIVHTESLYAANAPQSTTKLWYERFQLSGGLEEIPGTIIIVPNENKEQLCPVCGISWGGYIMYYHGGGASHDICPTCKLQTGYDDDPYDDGLDAQFGGQFGRYRKQWLDSTGWLEEDLDRIERVFQISTDEWPRDKN